MKPSRMHPMRGQPIFAGDDISEAFSNGKITMLIRWPLSVCFVIFKPAPSHQCASPKGTINVTPTRATSVFKQGVSHREGSLFVALNPSTDHHTEQGIAEFLYLVWHGLLVLCPIA